MGGPLRVLMSAYACEPGKGSEPEVGWQWALHMARRHEVTVLTRANNRPALESALAGLGDGQGRPSFVYHDLSPILLTFKRRFRAVNSYYVLWQLSAREVIRQLHRERRFELMHHVTFAAFRYPTAIWNHGVPSVWGPVGGIESIPFGLLPWRHPNSLPRELLRNLGNILAKRSPLRSLQRRARASSVVLASTPEMQCTFRDIGCAADLMPAVGLDPATLGAGQRTPAKGPLRLLFVGNLLTLKGIDLAIEALAASNTTATFALIGSGNYAASLRALADTLGLRARTDFRGRLPRDEVLRAYSQYDVFVFPSLHDTGGYAMLEAMCNELPVICLDCGGPAVAVQPGCGVRIPLGPRAEVIRRLAAAIRDYDQHRETVVEQGRKARASVLSVYDWERKADQMSRIYAQARCK